MHKILVVYMRLIAEIVWIVLPGEKLLQLEREKGIVIRFMIGHRYFGFTGSFHKELSWYLWKTWHSYM